MLIKEILKLLKKKTQLFLKKRITNRNTEVFNPNNPESVISLVLMQEEYLGSKY